MDKKLTGILAYITIVGWLVAFLVGDKKGANVHLNQGLILIIVGLFGTLISKIPFVGGPISWAIGVITLVFSILGIVYAATDKGELPIIGAIKILK